MDYVLLREVIANTLEFGYFDCEIADEIAERIIEEYKKRESEGEDEY